ncbi:hypothetical protein ACJ3XI_01210 [Litorimonas sp. RW-G-Af-16]|uniref:hypothetical protein n=1 Tax=Litorimonas sp. RW-G-Af-16 TaxID=3241168 RepID=UPI00390CBC92
MTKAERIANWEKTRKMGYPKYILIYGILLWAVPIWLLLRFVDYFQGNPPFDGWFMSVPASWLLGGVLFGSVMWFTAEKIHKAQKQNLEN